jgi:hypothetical protein
MLYPGREEDDLLRVKGGVSILGRSPREAPASLG